LIPPKNKDLAMIIPPRSDPIAPAAAELPDHHAWLEHLPVAAYVADAQGRLLYHNAAAAALWRVAPAVGAEPPRADDAVARRSVEERRAVTGEVQQWPWNAGKVSFVRARAEPWRDETGGVRGAVVVLEDLTAAREQEEVWRRQEERYRFIFENLPVGVTWHVNCGETHEVYNNPALERVTGVPNALGLSPQVYRVATHPEDLPRQMAFVEKFIAGEIDDYSMEKRFVHPDGQVVWVAFTTRRFSRVDGVVQALTTMVDITALKAAEEAARERTARLDFILNALPVGVIWTERDGSPDQRFCNRTFAELTGLTVEPRGDAVGAVIRASVRAISRPQDLARQDELQARVDRGEIDHFTIEKRYQRPDGQALWGILSVRAYRDAAGRKWQDVATLTDVTDRKALEEQLQQATRMQLVGQLAGGIAHDFNNILTVLLMNLQLVRLGSPHPESARRLGQMEEMCHRAGRLVQQLLMFARRQYLQPEQLNLNEVITRALELLPSAMGEHIVVDWQPATPPCWVEADEGMLEQVIMNLGINARDAMPDGGRLTLRLHEEEHLGSAEPAGPRPGRYVCIEVTDTGCGMSPEVLARVFEPFFTTKDPGRGTGLGLPSVQGVVQQQGGWVEIDSAPGRGTTVRVYLPARPPSSA
jgi:two-component system, cell cycle sensor histidine kinase and response regulator CckA